MNYELAIKIFTDFKAEVEIPVEQLDDITGLSKAPAERLYEKCNILLHNFYTDQNTATNRDFFIGRLNEVIQTNYRQNTFHRLRDLSLFIDNVIADLQVKKAIQTPGDEKTSETLREVIKEKEEENKHLSIVINGHEDQIDDLQRQLKESKKEVSRLQALAKSDSGMGMLAKYQGDISKYQIQSDALEEKERRIFDISAQRDHVKTQVEDLQRKLNESQTLKAFADATVDKLEKKVDVKEKELLDLKTKLREFGETVRVTANKLEVDGKVKQKTIAELKEKLVRKDAELNELKKNAVNGSVERIETGLKLSDELETARNTLNEIKEQLQLEKDKRQHLKGLTILLFMALCIYAVINFPSAVGYNISWNRMAIPIVGITVSGIVTYFTQISNKWLWYLGTVITLILAYLVTAP
jgi:hypothetical protein